MTRSLDHHAGPTTSWTYEDQEAALREGFNSVSEWGLWHAVRDLEDLKQRVAALENVHSEGQRVRLAEGMEDYPGES